MVNLRRKCDLVKRYDLLMTALHPEVGLFIQAIHSIIMMGSSAFAPNPSLPPQLLWCLTLTTARKNDLHVSHVVIGGHVKALRRMKELGKIMNANAGFYSRDSVKKCRLRVPKIARPKAVDLAD